MTTQDDQDDRTTEHGQPAPADRPAAPWTGEDRTEAGNGRPAEVTAVPVSPWTGEDRTSAGTAAPAWTGEDRTQAGNAPKPSVAEPAATASQLATQYRASTSSNRLYRGNSAARRAVLAALQKRDAGWLTEGGKTGPLSGTSLGDFLVGALLGEGGMGAVYRARQISLDRKVALKVLPPSLNDDKVLVERFAAEAHAGSLAVSPHVVQVYFAGSENGQFFFAMEYVDGTDLAHLLREHRDAGTKLEPGLAANYLLQAARGLQQAAAQQVVHRDIKPQNLLMTSHGMLKIADFGVAKVVGEGALTLAGNRVGTPAYSSPEQGRGDPVDPRSDLYSLGVVFYEMLTGERPFTAENADALIYKHNYAEPVPVCTVNANVPTTFQDVCMRLLMKDPDQRYQSPDELVADLERLIAGMPALAPTFETRFGTGASAAMSRHLGYRRLWLPAAVLIAALVGAVLFWYWQGRREDQGEMQRHRMALAALDQVASVPLSAPADLAWMRTHAGTGNPDVVRWSAKLARLDNLRKRLTVLDQDGVNLASVRSAAETDLYVWISEVGPDDPDAQRWTGRLAAADAEAGRLAIQLAELDRTTPVTQALAARLNPVLGERSRLIDDADQKRWTAAITAVTGRLDGLRTSLALLDGTTALREDRLRALRDELGLYQSMVGEADDAAVRWRQRLDQRNATIAQWRSHLARLDRVELATVPLLVELRPDFDALRAVAMPDDAQVRAWQAKIDGSQRHVTGLRQALGADLDRPTPLRGDELTRNLERLGSYRALVSPDDGQLLAWERRVAAESLALDRLAEALARLDDPAPMTVGEQAVGAKALAEAQVRQAVDEGRRARCAQRLADEATRVGDLRRQVRAALSAERFSPAARPTVDALSAAAGADDADVAAWNIRAQRDSRSRQVLAPLDTVSEVPGNAAAALADLTSLVGVNDADVVRWRTKLNRVQELTEQLAPLQRAEPVPLGAPAMLDELATRWIGSDAKLVHDGRIKVAEVQGLRAALAAELNGAMVLAVGSLAPGRLTELGKLEGVVESNIRRWRGTIALLSGPPRPAWAVAYGRDECGPWCEIDVAGQRYRLRFIPAGTAMMGSEADEPGRDDDEGPVRCSITRSLWFADSECRQSLYAEVMWKNPSHYVGAARPVDSVSRIDAENFCTALAQRVPGLRPRLPSEAEWERACRAGVAGKYPGPEGDMPEARLPDLAWFGSTEGTMPTAGRRPNRLGLYDMLGNVWEWCADGYGPYRAGTVSDPLGGGEAGIVRGGDWSAKPSALRAANRVKLATNARPRTVGFRIVAPIEWPSGREPGAVVQP